MWFHLTHAPAHNKLLVLEMEKEQKLGWRASVLPIPAFQHCELYKYVLHVCTQYTSGINTDTLHPNIIIIILVSVLFPSLHLKYFRIKFLL